MIRCEICGNKGGCHLYAGGFSVMKCKNFMPFGCDFSFELSEESMQEWMKPMEELDAAQNARLFTPGNRIRLGCGDKEIVYVAQEVTEC